MGDADALQRHKGASPRLFRVAPRLTLAADGFASGETVFEQRAADRKRKVTTLLAGAATEEDADRVRASRCRLALRP